MRKKNKQLIIGTANFGQNYGQGNLNTQLESEEIAKILDFAKNKKVNILDTAINYGDCSKKLGELGVKKWKIITKLPKIPRGIENAYDWCHYQVLKSIKELKVNKLEAVLLHYPEDLKSYETEIIESLLALKKNGIISKIGVSTYNKKEIDEILEIFQPEIIQCPLNIIDTRLLENNYLENISNLGIEIHVRSIFLQGILLNSLENLPLQFLKFKNFWLYWENWLISNGLQPLEACIKFINSISFIDKVIIGINSKNQLIQVLKYFDKTFLINKPDFSPLINDRLLDPRIWKL